MRAPRCCLFPALDRQVDVILVLATPVVFLLLMGMDPVSVFVPVGSSLLAASFVFAPSVQSFVSCMLFVLVQHPFDVGDVVRNVTLCGLRASVQPCRTRWT